MIHIWDIFIRTFHILLIYAMIGAYVTSENGNVDCHALWGITILSLLVFRILWGFLGSYNACFKNFIFRFSDIIFYIKSLFSRTSHKFMGHNPIGGLSVLAMMITLFLQSISGLAMTDDIFFEGPLYNKVPTFLLSMLDNLHRQNFNIIILLIILHVTAIFFYLFYKKDNLITPMITGHKKVKKTDQKKYATFKISHAAISILAAYSVWVYLYQMM